MYKSCAAAGIALLLTACAAPGPKMVDSIPNGVPVKADTFQIFQQGVRGGKNRPAAIADVKFSFVCDPNFQGGGSLQQRANAATKHSRLARDRVVSWLVNPRIRGGMMREVFRSSVDQQGCAPSDLAITRVTSDSSEVAQFVLKNKLLPNVMALKR